MILFLELFRQILADFTDIITKVPMLPTPKKEPKIAPSKSANRGLFK